MSMSYALAFPCNGLFKEGTRSNLVNKKIQFAGFHIDSYDLILIIESNMQTNRQARQLILPWAAYPYHQVAVLQTADQ